MKREILKDQLQLSSKIADTPSKSVPQFKGILYEKMDDGFGNAILKKKGENTVVVGGAVESLERLCGKEANWKPRTLNELLSINADVPGTPLASRVLLFGVGTGGSGLSFGSVVEKDIKRENVPDMIPLRVCETLTGTDADKYFMKKDNGDGTFSWYLKEFATDVVIKTCWKDAITEDEDGTEVLDSIADSSRTEGLQTFAEFILDFNSKDVREYFEAIGNLDSARYNSIGLFTGEKVELDDGTSDYVNVRLFSYLNIDNKSVRIKTASQYVYRVLSLV